MSRGAISLQLVLQWLCKTRYRWVAACKHAPLCNLPCNFLGLPRLYKVMLGSTFCNDCMDCLETIANCSSRLQRVTYLLQLFPTLPDKLQEKLHRVTPSYTVQSLQVKKSCKINCKEGHVTSYNLPATCLATPLRDKLQEKLHCVTLGSV